MKIQHPVKTTVRVVYILTKKSAIHHRFIPINECGTCDVDGSNYLLKAARNMWNEYVRQGYVFTAYEEIKKPLYTEERKRKRNQRVKSAMTTFDPLKREAIKAAKIHDMELQEARINPKEFFKKFAKEHPLTKIQCDAINGIPNALDYALEA